MEMTKTYQFRIGTRTENFGELVIWDKQLTPVEQTDARHGDMRYQLMVYPLRNWVVAPMTTRYARDCTQRVATGDIKLPDGHILDETFRRNIEAEFMLRRKELQNAYIESLHVAYRESRGYQGSKLRFGASIKTRHTHCWRCQASVSTDDGYICNSCSTGIVCSHCGACYCGRNKHIAE